LLVSIADTVALTGCSRSLIYELIATGTLKAVKVRRRTLIPHAELRRWVQSLPPAT
jgi:excisionase family DNA binding protein